MAWGRVAASLLKKYGDRARVDVVNVINQFTQLAQDGRVGFLGNVRVGKDLSLEELRARYNAVVLCYGAESDRPLGVPGENLTGVYSAREFVWWYNGHPHYAGLPIDLSKMRRVAICGLGNVAVDCARVLLQPADAIATTDIASHAVEQLRRSAVEEVHLVGRRGPVQAAFTPKELREVLGLDNVAVRMDAATFALSAADEAELKATRMKKRVFDILFKQLKESKAGAKTLALDFLRNPAEVIGDGQGQVKALKLEKTRLEPPADGKGDQKAVGTGEFETIEVDLVLKSIGFKSVAVPGVHFDPCKGVIPNQGGQVLLEDGSTPDAGLFVCGWLKRGPSGIIGTNLIDAEQASRGGLARAVHKEQQGACGSGTNLIDAEQASGGGLARAVHKEQQGACGRAAW
ncbi:hypothetical protein N2152v2_003858 [Parachlorella kessleri]